MRLQTSYIDSSSFQSNFCVEIIKLKYFVNLLNCRNFSAVAAVSQIFFCLNKALCRHPQNGMAHGTWEPPNGAIPYHSAYKDNTGKQVSVELWKSPISQ